MSDIIIWCNPNRNNSINQLIATGGIDIQAIEIPYVAKNEDDGAMESK